MIEVEATAPKTQGAGEVKTVITMNEVDAGFLEEIRALGGESIRKCYQCGSCTANCPLTSSVKAFPRRTLRLVQLGLRDRALQSPDMWLCSACATCRDACPRQADPGEIMAALRRYAYSKYSWLPGPTRSLTTSPRLPGALAGVFLVALAALVYWVSQSGHPSSIVDFGAFLPFKFIDVAGVVLGIAVAFGVGMDGWRMWKMIGSGPEDPPKWTIGERASNLVNVVFREVVFQRTLRKCNTGRLQWIAHLSLIMGFAGAAITTTLVFVLSPGGKPFPLDNPVKILGNASAALLLFGGTVMVARRILRKNTVCRTYFQDALFITLLYVVAITGTLSEISRLLNTSTLAYPSYAIHLTSIVLLLGLAPYTKFVHAIYRPLAMYIAKLRGWPD